MYERGEGVKKNMRQAADYYRIAANKGEDVAQYNLGILYENGFGKKTLSRDYQSECRCLLHALIAPTGVPKDEKIAFEWLGNYVSLSLSLSFSFFILSFSLSLSLFLFLYLSRYLSLSFFISLSLSLLYLFLYLSLSISLSLYLYL